MSLATIILTKNEARHISDCVSALRGRADAVIVWDSGSDDATAELAYLAGAMVIARPFDNYAAQRQAALDSVSTDWVLFVDADERVTPELWDEIRRVLAEPTCNGYWIPRNNVIVGRVVRGGGFSPDYQLRLLRREAAHYDTAREVHETVDVGGSEGYLTQPLTHYNYHSWAQFRAKQRTYARYEARILAGKGIRPRPRNFVLQPLREFRRRFFTLQGYRDGLRGLRLATLLAWYYGFVPYWILLTERDTQEAEE
jgi:glycosyltransferase involved in cell wall biosynthesis